MTFMALFRAPDMFKAGAALRPVTDWSHYNHEYTSNILNTPDGRPGGLPQVVADRVRRRACKGHLLIAHGMVDDNVFFQDSVRLAQRLIELKKDNWELAPLPARAPRLRAAGSWYDEYRADPASCSNRTCANRRLEAPCPP